MAKSATKIENILKVREDTEPLTLEQVTHGAVFSFGKEKIPSAWFPTDKKEEIKLSDLRGGIEPWLTSLFQSEHLSLLAGSGLSTVVHLLAAEKPNYAMSRPELKTDYADNITTKATNVAKKTNAEKPILRIISG